VVSDRIVFDCPQCGKVHVGLPAFAYKRPVHYVLLTEAQRETSWASDDFCVIDGEHFFVRAVLKIPIVGKAVPFEWGVWGTLSKANFQRYWDTYDDDDQSKLGKMFSWLASALDGYPDTLALRCHLVPCNDGQRPLIELQTDQDHPLVRDQINGISLERAIELARPVLHAD
jgi:hypothetical protein